MRSLLEDKPRVTRFPIEWDELPQSVPTIGDENQPPTENYAGDAMEEDYSFQKQNVSFGQQSNEYQQNPGFSNFPSDFSGPQPGFVEAGSAMEE